MALNSNIYHLELALEGKFEFLRKTNPWRSKEDVENEKMLESGSGEVVARKMQAWVMAMQGRKPDPTRQRGKQEGVVLPPGMEMPEMPSSNAKR